MPLGVQQLIKTNPNLVDKRKLEAKPEVIIQNLDRSLFVFSKKQIIIPQSGITEFYSIKLKFPITDETTLISMVISPTENEANVFVFPQKFVFSRKNQVANISVQI